MTGPLPFPGSSSCVVSPGHYPGKRGRRLLAASSLHPLLLLLTLLDLALLVSPA